MNLILDCMTGCKRLLYMIDKFVSLKLFISSTLKNIIFVTRFNECDMMKDIVVIFKVIKDALFGITSDEESLLTASFSFKYIFVSLVKTNTRLSVRLLQL
ncbi:hypothetical protein NGRA_1840 [Nosema granulosis]|uniref:Uncharacterized protein n=1 Tax=Nosema granulosis TaxID=83296 RepID=A0A9P6KZ00_9MICR|nr:hypothetical protein NGRA_1840 [Nosema granulosis]